MQNFEKPVSIDTPNILFQKEIERIKDIIGDPTVQSYAQVRNYLILLGIKIETAPSSLEIHKRISERDALIVELRQKGYPDSLDNLPYSKLEKLKNIPSKVVENPEELANELKQQQEPQNASVDEKEGGDPLGKVKNKPLRAAYKRLREAYEFQNDGAHIINWPRPIWGARNQQQPVNLPPLQPQQPVQAQQAQPTWLERRKQKALERKAFRTKYRIDPLDRGFLARIQIEKAQKLEQRMLALEGRAAAAKIKQRIPELILQRKLNKRVVDRYEKKIAIAERVVAMRGDPGKIELANFNIDYRKANPRPGPFRIIDKMANARDRILYSRKPPIPISELNIKKPFRKPLPLFGDNGIKSILRAPGAAPKGIKALFQTIKQLSNDLQGKGGGDDKKK